MSYYCDGNVCPTHGGDYLMLADFGPCMKCFIHGNGVERLEWDDFDNLFGIIGRFHDFGCKEACDGVDLVPLTNKKTLEPFYEDFYNAYRGGWYYGKYSP